MTSDVARVVRARSSIDDIPRRHRGARRGESAARDSFASEVKRAKDAARRGTTPTPGSALANPRAVLEDVSVAFVEPKTASNVGAMARACAAFECESLILCAPTCDCESRAALSAAKGAQYVVRQAMMARDLEHAIEGASAVVGFHPWTVEQLGEGVERFDELDALIERFPGGADDGRKLVLVFGNEADGLSLEQLRMCDAVCSIPMGRLVESLSVTHAAVIALSRYFERRDAKIERR